jgi:succinate-semialdehyde dehydrogenase/glutarate-semialdehyde dehydrogenase
MKLFNPATGLPIGDVPDHDPREVERRLHRAAEAFRAWRCASFADRGAALRAVAERLRRERDALARLMTEEMGKPILQAEAEIEKCAWVCEHFAEHGEELLQAEMIASDASKSLARCQPLGVVLAVMPWNFPFWQAFRAAAPALMAGNTMVLKHASNVPRCARAIERLFVEAGAPAGVMLVIFTPSSGIGRVIAHPAIAAVTLTGSEAAGRAVAAEAGAALKKTVLELGGSDPFVVLADADPVATAHEAVAARIVNSGQSCIAAKRFIVERGIAEPFERAYVERMHALKVGDPMLRDTEVGPLAREDLLTELERQVRASVVAGARLLIGGARLDRHGYFYSPTALSLVEPGMPVFDEETFGPVAPLVTANDADHALALANQSSFGLGASLWTSDAARGEALAERLEAGVVFVNGMVKSDPRLPFGGVKRSGYGRELARAGIREFVNVKSVWVR